jgi:thioredoxin reductase
MNSKNRTKEADVIIVGGGAAGLAAALILGRSLRHTIVLDDGHPRNESSATLNGFLTRDGIPPAEFLKIGREQLRRYETVEFRSIKVSAVERWQSGFKVELQDGTHLASRLLLLATGIVDELPSIEGLRPLYGKAVHSCPYCHGWETRDEPIAVIGGDRAAAELAIELLQWTNDVVLCSNGSGQLDQETKVRMATRSVRVIHTPIDSLQGDTGRLRGLRFKDGSFLPRTHVYFSPKQHQRSEFARRLGCAFDDEECVCCDEKGATCVPGLYVVGNASRGVQLAIAAAAEGTLAGVAINSALQEADAASHEAR